MMVCKQVFSHRRNSDKGISLRDIMRYLKTSTLWLLVCMSVLLQLTCSGVLPHRSSTKLGEGVVFSEDDRDWLLEQILTVFLQNGMKQFLRPVQSAR
nr:PREDICTED: uncharacterized protein LOC102350069 isoform X3 [Latimeria chalumnae]|eukprot:XP_014341030.1 PREDICTED: uncharacterized protein LOC102350069 isoform X3 [Latimeria chalumnae]